MSANILRSECRVSVDKENMYLDVQNNKSSGKNDCKNKKGLLVNAENPMANRTVLVKKTCPDKTHFKIYCDDNNENFRSRSRVRKNTCKIRTRQNSETTEKPCTSTTKVEKKKIASPDLNAVLCRARSSSNYRNRVPVDNKNNMSNKVSQRSCSESRKILPKYTQCVAAVSPHTHVLKSKHLSAEVKKRTLTSIEMWKDKMRKPYTGTVPKNLAGKYPNALSVDKVHTKIKQQKSAEYTKVLPQSSSNLQSKIDRIKQDENIKVSTFSWGNVIKHLPSEAVPILQNNNLLNARIDNNTGTNDIAENAQFNIALEVSSTTSATPLDGPANLPLTPTKVRYVKREVMCKLSTNIEVPDDIHPYEYDYLDDVPHMERQREDNAPKLSSRFLKENVNANQRRVVVGYLIRLGVLCEYSSNIIYQTVKLFDIAIDRILVETDNIQLLALACLWITLKREITSAKIPSVTTILQLAKELYIDREQDLLMYEEKILLAVKFNLRFADPFSLLCYYIVDVTRNNKYNIHSNDTSLIYFCGSYLLDISMLDESLCDTSACVLTIAAAELSLCAVYSDNISMDYTWCQLWRKKYLLTEWEERAMSFTKQTIMRQALESNRFGSNIVYKKYLRSKRCRISDFLLDKMRKAFYSVKL
ncbi:unnamed protein product [Lasius platythorax]|uniref:Cyclin N-terminal domain-containing protein n=1 Tax=Lasius platythorax TaxID=488582 RepID=A0AAV2N1U4_9HYME